MTLLSCSGKGKTILRIVSPPYELTTQCPYEEFEGSTEKELAIYIFSLQAKLDECNAKQKNEAEWFERMHKNARANGATPT